MKTANQKKNSTRDWVEAFFIIGLIGFVGVSFLSLIGSVWWLPIFILVLFPIVFGWVFKYHQYEIKRSMLNYIRSPLVLISVLCGILMLVQGNKYRTHLAAAICNGKVNKETLEDNTEAGSDVVYYYTPRTKMEKNITIAVGWFILIIAFVSPCLTIKCLGGLNEKENKPREAES